MYCCTAVQLNAVVHIIFDYRQEYVPYCFNALEPYYDTSTAVHVIMKTGNDGKVLQTNHVKTR